MEGLGYMLVCSLTGDKIINNYISEFSDDQVKLYVTNKQRETCERGRKSGKLEQLKEIQCGLSKVGK